MDNDERIRELETALHKIAEDIDPKSAEWLMSSPPQHAPCYAARRIAREALATAPPDSEPAEKDERFSHWMQSRGDVGTFYIRPEGFKVWPRRGPGLDGLWSLFVPEYFYSEADASIVATNYGSAEEAMAAVDHNWPVRDDEPAELRDAIDDAAAYGTGFQRGGQRIDPREVYKDPPQRGDALVLVDEVESYGHASAHTRKDLQRFRENCGALRRALAEAIPAEVMEILREAKNDASKLMWHYNAQGDLPQEMTYANKISLIDRALAQSEQGRVADGYTPVPNEVLLFLQGAGPLNGRWYWTADRQEPGPYWWRRYLPLPAHAAPQPQAGESDD